MGTTPLAVLQTPGTSSAPSAENPAWGQGSPALAAGVALDRSGLGPVARRRSWALRSHNTAPAYPTLILKWTFWVHSPLSHVTGLLFLVNLGLHREEACPWLPRWPGCHSPRQRPVLPTAPQHSRTHMLTQQTHRVPV